MERKTYIDTFGAVALVLFALNLAFNQVVVKVTNGGFDPVFLAGLRSVGGAVVLVAWMKARGVSFTLPRSSILGGAASGLLFAVEFMCLFIALDLTTVGRVSIIFYSMPVWLALSAHFLLPAERLNGVRVIGLVLAMAGVALALLDRSNGQASLLGDLLALFAAICWAAIALCVRVTPLARVPPEQQLLWQLLISAPLLLLAAPFFGDLLRDVQPIHLWGLAFQIIAVASFGFLAWFWLMSIYPASSVASFSFLSPVFAVILGWLLLGEHVGWTIWAALGLVAAGIFLINRK
ncbi:MULTISPECIES: DMT family transporter [Roseobacteraceae]|jgi:drug/metabolite transporter (DMT)-like permease|uniref:Putative cystine transporter YijE n=1 Tax=Pseudosulfitobacter pseudonitzschiae TaxID=1402135 RepID=A0A221JZF9_9RHOB|nr:MULTISPECIES: DMT family transporter [Roseobacteraceae]ASM72124.1 putative cystine transporter YijE [Pseudosulfitobacter pseudonitzschiae]